MSASIAGHARAITGGGSGIGLAIARRFDAMGVTLTLDRPRSGAPRPRHSRELTNPARHRRDRVRRR